MPGTLKIQVALLNESKMLQLGCLYPPLFLSSVGFIKSKLMSAL